MVGLDRAFDGTRGEEVWMSESRGRLSGVGARGEMDAGWVRGGSCWGVSKGWRGREMGWGGLVGVGEMVRVAGVLRGGRGVDEWVVEGGGRNGF